VDQIRIHRLVIGEQTVSLEVNRTVDGIKATMTGDAGVKLIRI
jgi:hypothetical protein